VTCSDEVGNALTNVTTFTVEAPPVIDLNYPITGLRTTQLSLDFNYTPIDYFGFENCTIVINGANNQSDSTVAANVPNYFTVGGLTEGDYNWTVWCIDADPDLNYGIAENETFSIDLTGPLITLLAPDDLGIFNGANITFNWTATDYAGTQVNCSLSVSNQTNGPLITPNATYLSGTPISTTIDGLSDGPHYWNVTCFDDLGNGQISVTRSFIINQPDLYLDDTRIAFNDSNPAEFGSVNITANVSNIGGLDAANANVTFWDGNPLFGGTYIGSARGTVPVNGSRVFSTVWTITEGYHTVYVSADPDDLIAELNETNNNATRNLSIVKAVITVPSNGTITNDTTPQISFNVTDFTSGNLTYRVFRNGAFTGLIGNSTAGTNTSVNLSVLPDGLHILIVQATDILGRSRNSTPVALRVDTTRPNVTFHTPNASWYSVPNVTINFSITDDNSVNISYQVFIDDAPYATNTTFNATPTLQLLSGLAEGRHLIVIQAADELGNLGNSSALVLYIDLTPPLPNITTPNATWFNSSTPNITFVITDNMDPSLNWTIYADGSYSVNGTAVNGTNASALVAALGDGAHSIILQATDQVNNSANTTPITIFVDTNAPIVTLLAPLNDTNLSSTSTVLNFTVTDNLAATLACTVYLDGQPVSNATVASGGYAEYAASDLASGPHTWYAACRDNASNTGLSALWSFFINLPDLAITAGNITLSNSTPIENQTITVTANVTNIGLLNATQNITVQFWNGAPGIGTLLLSTNISGLAVNESALRNTTVTVPIGLTSIYVVVDPPLATNGSISELNESNNIAVRTVWVGHFEVFAGSPERSLEIADQDVIRAFSWNVTNVTGSNLFVADTDSAITFTQLQGIGRTAANGSASGDFEEIDVQLGSTNLNDSVNASFTQSGSPISIMDATMFKRRVTSIPIVNSTNSSSFSTGILWDMADGGTEYDGSQDLVFFTIMNASQTGLFGTYDYEIRVPATLRDYIPGGGTVTFYTELR
jgi:hypothetical protein